MNKEIKKENETTENQIQENTQKISDIEDQIQKPSNKKNEVYRLEKEIKELKEEIAVLSAKLENDIPFTTQGNPTDTEIECGINDPVDPTDQEDEVFGLW